MMVINVPETITVNEHRALFPEVSVKVYTTLVDPKGNVSPGKALWVVVTEPELSMASGSVQVTVTLLEPNIVSTTRSDGHPVITGAYSSGMANMLCAMVDQSIIR